jgi:hypothetical protein
MIVLGLLVLLAAGGLSSPFLAAAALSGLARMVAGLAGGVWRFLASWQLPGDNTDRGH